MYCAVFSIHHSRCHLLHLHGIGSVLFRLRSPRLVYVAHQNISQSAPANRSLALGVDVDFD
jgi:hypothetical protein